MYIEYITTQKFNERKFPDLLYYTHVQNMTIVCISIHMGVVTYFADIDEYPDYRRDDSERGGASV